MRRVLLCVVGATSLLCGCGASNTATTATTLASEGAAASTSATDAGPQTLAFSAPQVGGGTLDLSAYAGKPVLLWFWAPT